MPKGNANSYRNNIKDIDPEEIFIKNFLDADESRMEMLLNSFPYQNYAFQAIKAIKRGVSGRMPGLEVYWGNRRQFIIKMMSYYNLIKTPSMRIAMRRQVEELYIPILEHL